MFDIVRYADSRRDEWNAFIAQSKNGTFLLDRRYMDYHRDRFADFSLMIYYKGQLMAVMPANAVKDCFWTHQGLTYGGLVMAETATAAKVQQLFRELGDYLKDTGFVRVIYKPVPHIFHRIPAEEDIYALFSVAQAQVIDRCVSSTVDLSRAVKWSYGRRYGANKARKLGVLVEESADWKGFWEVLEQNLMRQFGVLPVHSLSEIMLLHERFPEQIRLFTASLDDRIVGGTVLYVTPDVVHTQYISASVEGKRVCALDALFEEILLQRTWGARYFDFGTSNSKEDSSLAESLIFQKEGFGGRAICYDVYEWNL